MIIPDDHRIGATARRLFKQGPHIFHIVDTRLQFGPAEGQHGRVTRTALRIGDDATDRDAQLPQMLAEIDRLASPCGRQIALSPAIGELGCGRELG